MKNDRNNSGTVRTALLPLMAVFAGLGLVLTACQSSADEVAATEAGGSGNQATGQTLDSEPQADADLAVLDNAEKVLVDDGTSEASSESGDAESGTADTSPSELPASDEDDGDAGAAASLLAEGMQAAVEASSYRVAGQLTIEAADIPGSAAAIVFEGGHDHQANTTEVTVDLSGMGQMLGEVDEDGDLAFFEMFFADPIELIIIDDTSWINWDLLAMFAPSDGGDVWLEMESEQGSAMVDDLGADTGVGDPMEMLDALRSAAGDVEDLGADVVRGTDVTHYRMMVDLRELEAMLPEDEASSLDDDLGELNPEVPVDFWLDGDGQLRRVLLVLDSPEAVDSEAATITLDVELFDFGQDLGIEPPPADQILTEDDLGFDLAGEL